MRSKLSVISLTIVALVAAFLSTGSDDHSSQVEVHAPRVIPDVTIEAMEPNPPIEAVTVAWVAQANADLEAWYAGEARFKAEEEARLAEIKRQEEALANAKRMLPNAAPQTGSCCTHSDAWWQGVAICEQGGRNDPYFGYFSFMDGSQGGKPWADQVAAGNALLNRVGHEIGPWAASCVAAGYRASPGG